MKYVYETERLKIRRFEPKDAERLFNIHLDEEVKKWIPGESYEDIEEAEYAIIFFADCVDKNKLPYVLAVELKESGEVIGDTGINEVEGNPEDVEIGFVIGREHRGKGYATEVVRAMTEFTGSILGIKTVYGRVMKGNDASAKVLEKAGYSFVTEEADAEDDPYGNGMLVYKKQEGKYGRV
ncbi:MAG: GNAT family N-acetyltransferase [Lachnospiraceae bacterium]|nr:GNAT family N-acetyltransferase [Lachnospiraceae bacterium]